ncbi:MAG: MG2 domain-containing protein [Anaerolineae bacterium]
MENTSTLARPRNYWPVIVTALVALALIAVMGWQVYRALNYSKLTVDTQQTFVVGPSQFEPDAASGVRVVVINQRDGQPIANANVIVRMAPRNGGAAQTLYSGKTDVYGTAPISFTLPANTPRDQVLIIETDSSVGRDQLQSPVTVQRSYKVLVTSDKPLYQPGQTMHLRALALSALNRLPAKNTTLDFLVEDPKGNKVLRKSVETSAFGIASADFQLADTVITGDYKITATLGDTKSDKTVTVKPYVLPKFKVAVETDKSYYLPGEQVTGRVRADYFFGKPVSDGIVALKGVAYDVQRNELVKLDGKTNTEGVYEFQFKLPGYFTARGLDNGRADFTLELGVTDQANHLEETSLVLPIASAPMVIDAVPESGKLMPGIENIVYILTALPDGTPADANVTVLKEGQALTTRTGKYGLGQVQFTPQANGSTALFITAKDSTGRETTKQVALQTQGGASSILLRPDRAVYRAGETMHLDVFTSGGIGTVYLDLIREGQTVSTRAVDAAQGHATVDVDVTPELAGTVQMHAYHVEKDGTIVRDTRLVVVQQAEELNVAVKADKDTYRPGDTAHLVFNVTNHAGSGVPSALGITAVDESVFALQQQDPGFAKLYFLLQSELLEPKYEIHGFGLPEVMSDTASAELRTSQDVSAQAAWANAPVAEAGVNLNSAPDKRDKARVAEQQAFTDVSGWLALVLSLLPFAFGGLIVASLARQGMMERAIAGLVVLALLFCLASPLFVGAISVMSSWVTRYGPIMLGSVVTLWLVTFAYLFVYFLRKGDARLAAALVLVVAYTVLGALLVWITRGFTLANPLLLLTVALTYLAGLGALLLLGAGLFASKERTAGIAAVLLALLFIPATIFVAAMPGASPFARATGNPVLYMPIVWLTGCSSAAPTGAPPTSAPAAQATVAPAATAAPTAGTQPGAAPAPRLRQYFPETLYVNPELLTDDKGFVSLDMPLADSITTWRLAATASSQRGDLGATQAGIRVFQDFFIDLDLPVALTQNDEISLPVAVYNYLPQDQKIQVGLDKADWFTLTGDATQTLTIASNDIQVIYFRIKATGFGSHKLKVTALGAKMSDALQREVQVYPDGKLQQVTHSNWLHDGTAETVEVPAAAVPGASRIEVKLYPGVMSQLVEGLDAIFQTPHGCFEQTSSTTFPNVLALNYLKQTRRAAPEVQMKAETYIGLGYQRLLTFENPGGGFSLFGGPPPSAMLSAKGLLEFKDMSQVYPVDPAIIQRTRGWLLSSQKSDGTWDGAAGWDHPPESKGDPLPLTAIVTWALLETGDRQEAGAARGIAYLKSHLSSVKDAYTLSLIANALVAYDTNDPATHDVLARLDAAKTVDGDKVYWTTAGSFSGATGRYGSIETTALVSYAMQRAHAYPDSTGRALTYLVQSKDPNGTWGTTQATILSLRSLVLAAIDSGESSQEATIQVSLNGGSIKPVHVTSDQAGMMYQLSFDDIKPGPNQLAFQFDGKGPFAYEVTTTYYLPWDQVPPAPEGEQLLAIQIQYDRTSLAVNDEVGATVKIGLNRPGTARMALVDLGIPPGFAVVTDELDAAVKNNTLSRYELTGRQLILYIDELNSQKPVTLTYHLRAKYPVRVKAPSSTLSDYYNPDISTTQPPVEFVVH